MFGKLANYIEERTHLSEIFKEQMVDYKVPKNLTFPYAFGVLAIVAFTIQILSGMILLMYYKPYDTLAFDSTALFIWKVVPYGWLFRSIHAAGANFFLAVVYLHMFTGIYYNAYKKPRELVWVMGFIIYFLLLLTALTGYVLPWGQLSYWATEVTVEIPGAIPGVIGETVSLLMRGGYTLGNLAIGRFFALHVLILPLILLGVVSIHLFLVRAAGISNPDGMPYDKKKEGVNFHPYVTLKEGAVAMFYLALFFFFVFFYMKEFLPGTNWEPANPLQTPAEIAPEWYLKGFYAIFRSIPNKFIGFITFNLVLGLILLLPWLDFSPIRSARRRPLFFIMYIVFMTAGAALTVVGTLPATPEVAKIGLFFTALLFLFFISLPIISFIELGAAKMKSSSEIETSTKGGK